MTVEEIEAIVGGYHGDAFRVLGPHTVRRRGGQPRWEVRALLPQAESAEVVAGAQRCAMARIHADGLFSATLTGEPVAYRIVAKLWDGREVEMDDPYRFGPLVSDTDIYLHNEGTSLRGVPDAGARTSLR